MANEVSDKHREIAGLLQENKGKVEQLDQVFSSYFLGEHLAATGPSDRRISGQLLAQLPVKMLVEAMEIACTKLKDEAKEDAPDNAVKYFCGVCWQWIKKPESFYLKQGR